MAIEGSDYDDIRRMLDLVTTSGLLPEWWWPRWRNLTGVIGSVPPRLTPRWSAFGGAYNRRSMEVAEGVHQIQMLGADSFLIAEERLTLIDAGMVGSRRMLHRHLRGMGRSIDELERIICTHGHPDHIGGVNELVRGRDDVEVLIHPADLEGLQLPCERRSRARRTGRSARSPDPVPDPRARASARRSRTATCCRFSAGCRSSTPPATPREACASTPSDPRLLFTGDVLQVIRGHLAFASPIFSHDHAQAAGIGRATGPPRCGYDRLQPLSTRGPMSLGALRDLAASGGALTAVRSDVAQAEDAHVDTVTL